MSRPARPSLPMRDGLTASTVALPAGPWPTLLDFMAHRLPAVTRDDWAARFERGDVLHDSALPARADEPCRPGLRLHYWRTLAFEHPVPFEETVLFQDDWIVVADKPPFLPVTPKGAHVQHTLLTRLKRRLNLPTLVPAHRIDLETSGLVLLSIQPATRDAYQRLFRDRAVHKTYEAIAPLGPDRPWPQQRHTRLAEGTHFMTMQEVAGEPNALTRIALQDTREDLGLGRYRLQPVTGQKHQLRVHMNALGRPIVGDRLYPVLRPQPGPGEAPDFSEPLKLVARSLQFTDPFTGQLRHFESHRTLDWD